MLYAIYHYIFRGIYIVHFTLYASNAADIYFIFCRRQGRKTQDLIQSIGFRAWIYDGIHSHGLVCWQPWYFPQTISDSGKHYLEIIKLPFFKGINQTHRITGIFSAFLFGLIYSISLTPCVGAFLGSALMLASSTGGAIKGTLLLLTYSLGLGIPFVFSAILIDRFKGAFSFIKNHYKIINLVSGIFLIIIGILIMSGLLNSLLSLFS